MKSSKVRAVELVMPDFKIIYHYTSSYKLKKVEAVVADQASYKKSKAKLLDMHQEEEKRDIRRESKKSLSSSNALLWLGPEVFRSSQFQKIKNKLGQLGLKVSRNRTPKTKLYINTVPDSNIGICAEYGIPAYKLEAIDLIINDLGRLP